MVGRGRQRVAPAGGRLRRIGLREPPRRRAPATDHARRRTRSAAWRTPPAIDRRLRLQRTGLVDLPLDAWSHRARPALDRLGGGRDRPACALPRRTLPSARADGRRPSIRCDGGHGRAAAGMVAGVVRAGGSGSSVTPTRHARLRASSRCGRASKFTWTFGYPYPRLSSRMRRRIGSISYMSLVPPTIVDSEIVGPGGCGRRVDRRRSVSVGSPGRGVDDRGHRPGRSRRCSSRPPRSARRGRFDPLGVYYHAPGGFETDQDRAGTGRGRIPLRLDGLASLDTSGGGLFRS